jgi:hypothetical protein
VLGKGEPIPYVRCVEASTDRAPDPTLTPSGSVWQGFSGTPPGSVVAEMRALRARVKPDPEGWTTRDYVQYGRR